MCIRDRLSSLGKRHVDEAYLVSPIVDMEKLMCDIKLGKIRDVS